MRKSVISLLVFIVFFLSIILSAGCAYNLKIQNKSNPGKGKGKTHVIIHDHGGNQGGGQGNVQGGGKKKKK